MQLTSTNAVIEALGGNRPVARLTARNPKAVSNWRQFQTFPSDTFLALTAALDRKGHHAPSSLWRQVQAESENA